MLIRTGGTGWLKTAEIIDEESDKGGVVGQFRLGSPASPALRRARAAG